MDLEKPIFEKVVENCRTGGVSEETIEEWKDASEEYWDRDEVVVGMHGSLNCEDVEGGCCDVCEEGHTVVTGTQDRDSGNVIKSINCTEDGCTGLFL